MAPEDSCILLFILCVALPYSIPGLRSKTIVYSRNVKYVTFEMRLIKNVALILSYHCLPWIFVLWEARCHVMRHPLGKAYVVRSWNLHPVANEELRCADSHLRKLESRPYSLSGAWDEWSPAWQLDCHLLGDPNEEPHCLGDSGCLTLRIWLKW